MMGPDRLRNLPVSIFFSPRKSEAEESAFDFHNLYIMAKSKLTELKKYLAELDEEELRKELLKLFNKLPQVQEYYAQELMGEKERKAVLDSYKKKIYTQFWTRGGMPKNPSNAEIRRIIGDFEKISVFSHELADLLIYRVEVATEFADSFGGLPESDYKPAVNAFEKALKIIAENRLESYFKARCEKLFQYRNLDWWYIESLMDIYRDILGK